MNRELIIHCVVLLGDSPMLKRPPSTNTMLKVTSLIVMVHLVVCANTKVTAIIAHKKKIVRFIIQYD